MNQILHALHACRIKGVVRHGDLHSGNILIGDATTSTLDDALDPRAPIFVSDFGYGATGAKKMPKDDYEGLAKIINEMIRKLDYSKTSVTDRRILQSLKQIFSKLLNESTATERTVPFVLLRLLQEIKCHAQSQDSPSNITSLDKAGIITTPVKNGRHTVGQFQVSEMIGDHWERRRHSFPSREYQPDQRFLLLTFRQSSLVHAVVAKRCF